MWSWLDLGDYVLPDASYPIGRFCLIYFIAVMVVATSVAIFPESPVPLVIYAIGGVALNQLILGKVQWNPLLHTVSRLARSKMLAIIVWPFAYPVFFVKLFVIRWL